MEENMQEYKGKEGQGKGDGILLKTANSVKGGK
jgi:hypothetical protein